jgi:hypothetical protein
MQYIQFTEIKVNFFFFFVFLVYMIDCIALHSKGSQYCEYSKLQENTYYNP